MMKKLLMMTVAVSALLAAAGPIRAQKLVKWDMDFLRNLEISGVYASNNTNGGITLTAEGSARFEGNRLSMEGMPGDQIVFTSSVGNITEIVINAEDIRMEQVPDGWTKTESKMTWTGTPAASVAMASSDFMVEIMMGHGSIVFTVALQNVTITDIPTGWQVTADGNPVSVTNGEAVVAEGAIVNVIPTPADKEIVKNVTLSNLRMLTIGTRTIYYQTGETWAEAIANHPTENAGWSTTTRVFYNGDEVLFNDDTSSSILPADDIDKSINYGLHASS